MKSKLRHKTKTTELKARLSGFYFLILAFFLIFFTNITGYTQDHDNYTDKGWDLLYAADIGDKESIGQLIDDGVNPDFENYDGVTAIMLASQQGYDDIVEYLIKCGADVNKKSDYNGITPIISAVRNDFLRTAEILIRNGANVNDNDNWGRQAIHYSAINGHTATTDMLIYYFADVDDKDIFGNTPLIYAVVNKNDSIAELLIKNNADLFAVNDQGNSIFHIAAYSGNAYFVENYHTIYQNKELYNTDSLKPIEMAILYGQSEIAEFLINENYSLRDTINNAYTPLTLAKSSKDRKTIKQIKKMDINNMHYPYFRRVGVGFETLFNSTEFFMGFNLNLTEDRYGIVVCGGFLTRAKRKEVWVLKSGDDYYQYLEKRYGIYVKIQKHFKLFGWGNNNYLSLYPQIRPIYVWGNYSGTNKIVPNEIIPTPGIGFLFNFGNFFRINFNYEYCDMNIYLVNPHMYSIGIKFLFSYRNTAKNEKYKYIINY